MTTITPLSTLLQPFFTDRLMKQRQASPHTIASYRDTFRLLLEFAYQRLKKPPSKLDFEDLTAPFIGEFLDHIQSNRHSGTRTRNLRLTAIRSFFHYAAFQEPSRSAHIQRVLAIPVDVKEDVAFLSSVLFEFFLLFYWFSGIEKDSFYRSPVSRFG